MSSKKKKSYIVFDKEIGKDSDTTYLLNKLNAGYVVISAVFIGNINGRPTIEYLLVLDSGVEQGDSNAKDTNV
jgi:hypothetical protein